MDNISLVHIHQRKQSRDQSYRAPWAESPWEQMSHPLSQPLPHIFTQSPHTMLGEFKKTKDQVDDSCLASLGNRCVLGRTHNFSQGQVNVCLHPVYHSTTDTEGPNKRKTLLHYFFSFLRAILLPPLEGLQYFASI